ncbi:hypothetical protein D3C74_273730 [compost metagenome]
MCTTRRSDCPLVLQIDGKSDGVACAWIRWRPCRGRDQIGALYLANRQLRTVGVAIIRIVGFDNGIALVYLGGDGVRTGFLRSDRCGDISRSARSKRTNRSRADKGTAQVEVHTGSARCNGTRIANVGVQRNGLCFVWGCRRPGDAGHRQIRVRRGRAEHLEFSHLSARCAGIGRKPQLYLTHRGADRNRDGIL